MPRRRLSVVHGLERSRAPTDWRHVLRWLLDPAMRWDGTSRVAPELTERVVPSRERERQRRATGK